MSKLEFRCGTPKPEILKHILKRILFLIFLLIRRKNKKGPKKDNEK